MGAYSELQSTGGVAGAATFEMMRSVASQVVGRYSFPPPEGYGTWGQDAIDVLLGDLFSRAREEREALLVTLLVSVADDEGLKAKFYTVVHNFLKDRAKATSVGKLRRRMVGLLDKDERFVRPAAPLSKEAWALVGRPAHLWDGVIADLHAAAHRIRGYFIPRLNPAGPTPAPVVKALTDVSQGVIDYAAAAVADQDLATVLQLRFDLAETPMAVALPTGPSGEDVDLIAQPWATTSEYAVVETIDLAETIWAQFSPEEKALFPLLAEPVETRCAATGLGRHTVETLSALVVEMVTLATVDDDNRDEVVAAISKLAESGAVTSSTEVESSSVATGGAPA